MTLISIILLWLLAYKHKVVLKGVFRKETLRWELVSL
ncbi:Putative protein [Zobellia galactanivorans]|uniref:Uncharacterized protein n=1 Tax=Zobellia galactanivorans (strain DSM 12802 / CCUG 47099 / CIP 106680 / NCIMB 13871 / Dsij) TaxID=63186 RepID=G0KZH3_ZOBGA|nr:Putative protein [Zobellia galactanivorans]